ncbi:hypothetical protein KSF78_0007649 [Schistosoma japonicum]|nr:hypothetical protein KSF78_0007649 [Schistosoma japonicum]
MNRMNLCLLFVSLVLISMQGDLFEISSAFAVLVQARPKMSRYRLDDTCYVCDCYDIVLYNWQITRSHYELPPYWMCPSCNCDKTAVM